VEEPEPERLLLTPALRVAEPQKPVQDAPQAEEPAARPRTSLEERIAELELAVGSVAEEFEPDGSEAVDEETPRRFFHNVTIETPQERPEEDEAPIALDVAEEPLGHAAPLRFPGAVRQVEEAPVSELHPVADAHDADDTKEDQSDDELLNVSEIDEAMLREIVAEIVRSELQGELGERITRNVRKLVRREIHRALMSRDFS
jgi:hypothetical protein